MPTGTTPTVTLTPTQKFIADLQADNVRQQARLVKEQEQIDAFSAAQTTRANSFSTAQATRGTNFNAAQSARETAFNTKSAADIAAINARITQNNASLAAMGA